MKLNNLRERIETRWQRSISRLFYRRRTVMHNTVPLISFTFDDFPRSALRVGGEILKEYGFRGTYYTSFGLMGQNTPVGNIFLREDLKELVADGHELGCHTFAHCDAWYTPPSVFERSIIDNQRALSEVLPEGVFRTLSYPISYARPNTQRRVAKYFPCCRNGGQTYNAAVAFQNRLYGFFLEQSRDNPDAVKQMIDQNCKACGWLIFVTHDVCEDPSRFGCTSSFFESILRYAANSDAKILPVGKGWEVMSTPDTIGNRHE